YMFHLMN
uniref:Deltorphin-like peptide n=1 Tax=Phyllomedusa burmeisteri TaxID=39413 RepID=DELT_PHYBU|nr:RecName: Full=Deltorphin-like peptide [Phyllomedusa burmeisteri]